MQEKAVRFGSKASLLGILTKNPKARSLTDPPAVIFLNSGILHHIGSCRLHVRAARMLAREGYASLRFDHSGIGDSTPRRGTEKFEESSVQEVREAMDYLSRNGGYRKFVLFGLCSGADVAFETALKDERVCGLVQLDPWCYPTLISRLRYWRMHYLPRLLQADVWSRFFKRVYARVSTGLDSKPMNDEEFGRWFEVPEYVRKTPTKRYIAEGSQRLVDRGVRILAVFTGGSPNLYNYRRQYEDSLPGVNFKNLLQVEHLPAATHIFTRPDHQQFVLDTSRNWMRGQAVLAPEPVLETEPPLAMPHPA